MKFRVDSWQAFNLENVLECLKNSHLVCTHRCQIKTYILGGDAHTSRQALHCTFKACPVCCQRDIEYITLATLCSTCYSSRGLKCYWPLDGKNKELKPKLYIPKELLQVTMMVSYKLWTHVPSIVLQIGIWGSSALCGLLAQHHHMGQLAGFRGQWQ